MDIVKSVQCVRKNDRIQIILKTVKNQVQQYRNEEKGEKSVSVLSGDRRIQQLLIEEKNVLAQFKKVRKELKRCQRRYEKILCKKVKHMKVLFEADCKILAEAKQKCLETETQLSIGRFESKKTVAQKSKKANKLLKVKTLTPNFKQKDIPLSRHIKIKIKGNGESRRCEIYFLNDANGQNGSKNLVNIVKPIALNNRECRVILQKLTEEQINKYVGQKRLGHLQIEEDKPITKDILQNVNETIVCPNWQIKIPRSIFEEIQNEGETYDWNLASCSKEVI